MLILPPFIVGDTATLHAPRDLSCTVIPPTGEPFVIDEFSKRINIPLTMAGTYRYEFSDGSTGELVVVDTDPASVVVP